jgi:uncharacterized protein
MINVPKKDLKTIITILQKHLADCEIRAFGSRVRDAVKPYSDLDLAIVGIDKVPLTTIFAIKEKFQESNIPFRVDIIDWNRISDSFKKIIEEQYEIINLY